MEGRNGLIQVDKEATLSNLQASTIASPQNGDHVKQSQNVFVLERPRNDAEHLVDVVVRVPFR